MQTINQWSNYRLEQSRWQIKCSSSHRDAAPLNWRVRRTVTHWTPTDLPYEIHTGRELEFMLNRAKPLAHFSDYYPPEPDEDIIPQRAFAPFVSSGLFEMRAFVRLISEPPPRGAPHVRGVLHVLYASPRESWRIEAFLELLEAAETQPWSEAFERREGTLLGYSPAQNDAHIERMLKAPHASNFPWLKRLLKQRQ